MVQIYEFFAKRKSNSHKKLRFGGGEATRTAQYSLPKLPKLPNLLIPHKPHNHAHRAHYPTPCDIVTL